MIGQWHGLVIDCPDPGALASFYEELLGMTRVQDDGDWVVIGYSADKTGVAFQRVDDYRAPLWPQPTHPQQMHLDIRVDDLATADDRVRNLGGRPLDGGGNRFRVYADPVGHPFCLVQW